MFPADEPTEQPTTSDWHIEPKPEIPELDKNFEPVRTNFVPLIDKLDHATIAQLRELARGGIGEPDISTIRQQEAIQTMAELDLSED